MQSNFVIAVLLLYLPIGAGIIVMLKGIRGVMAAMIIGWIFLPPARGINLPGLPMYTKEFAVAYAILLGVLISDSSRIFSFKFRLIDIPVVLYVTAPFMSSVTNGLGAYDGLSAVYSNIFMFAVPYFIGRIYIRTPDDIKQVAIWIVISGLILSPFVLWESRMSPNLNYKVYGYHAAQFGMSVRLGGYRPIIFMRHGLEVGLWLATSAAVAGWLAFNTKKTGSDLQLSDHPNRYLFNRIYHSRQILRLNNLAQRCPHDGHHCKNNRAENPAHCPGPHPTYLPWVSDHPNMVT